jgi:thiol-disulfide isomerase/thioredoxin
MIRSSGDGPMAHDFELTLFNGETLALSELRGQVVVLNFWASWCPSCRWEMPAFETMYQEYQDRGVIFVGVAVSDFEEDAREFAEMTGVTYPIGLDLTGISRDYRVLTLPTTVFINAEGRVARTLKNAANETVLRLFIEGQIRLNDATPKG